MTPFRSGVYNLSLVLKSAKRYDHFKFNIFTVSCICLSVYNVYEYDLSSSCYLSYFVYIYNVYFCLLFGFSLGRKYASLINFVHQHFGYR